MAFEYKGIAEKQISKGFYSASAYVTSLIIVHIPFTLFMIVFFYKYVVLALADVRTLRHRNDCRVVVGWS